MFDLVGLIHDVIPGVGYFFMLGGLEVSALQEPPKVYRQGVVRVEVFARYNFCLLGNLASILRIKMFLFNLYINTGWWSLSRLPSTFAPADTHANVFFVFLPGSISKECHHILSANCDFEGNYLADIV